MSREHVGLVEAAYAAVDRDDIDALLALVHPEAEFRSLIAESEGLVYAEQALARMADWTPDEGDPAPPVLRRSDLGPDVYEATEDSAREW